MKLKEPNKNEQNTQFPSRRVGICGIFFND